MENLGTHTPYTQQSSPSWSFRGTVKVVYGVPRWWVIYRHVRKNAADNANVRDKNQPNHDRVGCIDRRTDYRTTDLTVLTDSTIRLINGSPTNSGYRDALSIWKVRTHSNTGAGHFVFFFCCVTSWLLLRLRLLRACRKSNEMRKFTCLHVDT